MKYSIVITTLISFVSTIHTMEQLCNDFIIVPKPPSIATCAHASSIIYKQEITKEQLKTAHLDNYALYMPTKNIKDAKGLGFKGIAFIDHQSKQCIISYRGTDPTKIGNVLQDIGIFFADTQQQNRYEILHNQLRLWLWGYDKRKYMMHKAAHLTLRLGEYLLSWKSGIVGTVAQKLASLVVNHKVLLYTLVKMIGLAIDASSESYIDEAIQDAQTFFDDVKEKLPDYYFYVTGHSLGGFLAQIVGAKNNAQTYTFNAPGAQNTFKIMYPGTKFNPKLIVNIIRKNDIFGTFEKHIGSTQKLPNYLKGMSMCMSSDRMWDEFTQKQYEDVIASHWNKHWYTRAKTMYNPYVYTTKDGSSSFDLPTYLFDTTSMPDYMLENHSITNLVNDLTFREQYHLNF